MISTVKAVAPARKTARYVCSPRFLNASSGPYAEEESPSAPRLTQARNATSEMCRKRCGSSRSFGPPRSSRFSLWPEVGGGSSAGLTGSGSSGNDSLRRTGTTKARRAPCKETGAITARRSDPCARRIAECKGLHGCAVHFARTACGSELQRKLAARGRRLGLRRLRNRLRRVRLRLGVLGRQDLRRRQIEDRLHRTVIARAELAIHLTGGRARGERRARQHVVESPPDVSLPEISPRRPPGEEPVVVRPELSRKIHEPGRDHRLEERPLGGRLADLLGPAQARMHVALFAGDVEIATEDHPLRRRARNRSPLRERLEEAHLRGTVLVAVRHVDGGDERVVRARDDDAIFVIELRMLELRLARKSRLAQVQRDARVAFVAVPVPPVSLESGKLRRNVLGRRLDLLHAEDVGGLFRDPLQHLRDAGPDPVDVPGGDLHQLALLARDIT